MELRQLYGANVSFTLYKYKVKKHRLHTGGEGTLGDFTSNRLEYWNTRRLEDYHTHTLHHMLLKK